jgi:hypothetical protein
MDSSPPAVGDVKPQFEWANLRPGQEVEIRESGRPGGRGVIDNLTPDASVVWVRIDGHAQRRL